MFPPERPTESFPYQILEQIGVGSMGAVYRAMEVDLERVVAVKTLRNSLLAEETPETQEEMRRRFRQEAQAAGRISHPGVTTVYRVGEEESTPYLVMEWLEGQSLDQVMKLRNRLPAQEAGRIVMEVLDALEAAHKVGVIHRDVKPSNLVLLDNGRIKVTDFGIARIQGHELVKTQAGVVLATPKFASPEQLQGIEVDGRADVFAVGVLFYHLLTGTFPFLGGSFLELANAILQKDYLPLDRLIPDLPSELLPIVNKALYKDRQDRFRSAGQMADALRSWLQVGTQVSSASQIIPPLPVVDIESSVRGLPHQQAVALVELASTWPGKVLERQDSEPLIQRLLDRPLHAPAFSGAVFLGEICLFLSDGTILAAADRKGRTGDVVMEDLPEVSIPGLHPLPEEFGIGLLPVLTSCLHPPDILHADLDSSYINLPAMAAKLQADKFNGLVRLRHGNDWGMVCFVDGQAKLSLYSEGWNQIPVEKSWQHWISDFPIHAQVERRVLRPPAFWFRRTFGDLAFEAQPVDHEGNPNKKVDGSTSTHLRRIFSSTRTGPIHASKLALRLSNDGSTSPVAAGGIPYEMAPAVRFLNWMTGELPRYLAERDLFARYKYLAEWIFLMRQAKVYHPLERPDSSKQDFFDLVTADEKGKVLHLAHRLASPDPQSFADTLQRVVDAKTARKKTGDVGGVFFIAPSFDEETLQAYRDAIGGAATSGKWFGVEESFTGYEGFVRIGPRRGFHLLLVNETAESFEPILMSTLV